jgi:predicted acyltransferase
MNAGSQTSSAIVRLESLDALRGFDMFWIVGGSEVLRALLKGTGQPWLSALDAQFTHFEWEGFHFFDLIMPLFLFMIGVSMPFSFAKRLELGQSRRRIFGHVLLRVAVLCVLGMTVNGKLLTYDVHQFQLTYSVLHVLAMGYLVAAIVLLTVRWPWQIAATVLMLAAYGVIQYFPAPGCEPGAYAPNATWGDWLNERLLGPWQGEWRRPWIVSMTTYGSTAMLGALAGQWLRSAERPVRKALGLAAIGLVCLAAGWAWSYQMPIVKKTWTSSYALWAGGWSFLLLALFYLLIDVAGLRRWALPFRVIGMNPIAAYLGWQWFSPALHQAGRVFVGGLKQHVAAASYAAIEAAAAALGLWLILFWLYRSKTFIKI